MSEARSFLSVLTGSFAMPAAENPTVAMVEAAYRHHRLDARYLNCEVPAAALTAYARSEDRMKALKAGFQIHLAKPIDPAELVTTIASLAKRVVVKNPAQASQDSPAS